MAMTDQPLSVEDLERQYELHAREQALEVAERADNLARRLMAGELVPETELAELRRLTFGLGALAWAAGWTEL